MARAAGLLIARSGFEPLLEHSVVFFAKILDTQSALNTGVYTGTVKLSGQLGKMLGNNLRWTSIITPSRYNYSIETGLTACRYGPVGF